MRTYLKISKIKLNYKLDYFSRSSSGSNLVDRPHQSASVFSPWINHNLQIEILPMCFLRVPVVDPLGASDVGEVVQHDEVLSLPPAQSPQHQSPGPTH